ncbi:growth-regulating factor 8 isoform X2 [Ricinus communis]|uniref:growth-regulating factor 8 isoform X2 n=1 Tax=Ricinus communis TaxID=3988 RepID=UPI000772C91D|nr:growth-regulating factor 8 isoform X2 [Ricinus communis]|eukprot:XP_015574449.1 growth-regulating factor 8 isoform X2 [Ricinus communis]
MGTRSGVSFVGSKKEDKAKDLEVLRMQAKESYRVMSEDHHHHEGSTQLLPSSSSSSSSCSGSFDGGGSGAGAGGPLFYSRSNRVACFGDIYDVVGASDADAVLAGSKFSSFTFNLSGEMTPSSMNMGVPFTAAQLQELERQTIIYKHMMASIPVPPELLIPITKTQSNASPTQFHEMGISSCTNSDPEPWRCKRTDGKKWRCSRDVAPDQKYCERHSHKSRPRSRKPVELHTDSMASNSNNYITNTQLLNQKPHFPSQTNSHLSNFPSAMVSASATAANSFNQPRGLEWFLKGETAPVPSNSDQEWHYLKQDRIKGSDEKLYHYREGQYDSNSYMNLRDNSHSLQAHRLNENCSLLLSPKSTILNPSSQTQAQETRHFLDAWSTAMRESNAGGLDHDQCSDSSSEKILPLSTLTLSMCGVSQTNEENDNGQASSTFGIMGSDKDAASVLRPHWMMNHGSWMSSPPGGPLAEALCLGISNSTRADSNLASSNGSSYDINNNS